MGSSCCKNGSRYVRQHDDESNANRINGLRDANSQNGLIANGGDSSGGVGGGFPRMPSEVRPSEDSTKGSETELDGGFQYEDIDDGYQNDRETNRGTRESGLSRRLGRFRRRRRRPPEDDLFGTSLSPRSRQTRRKKDEESWRMSPEAVCTGGHQELKDGKQIGKSNVVKTGKIKDGKEDENYYSNGQSSASTAVPPYSDSSHYNHNNGRYQDPYMVHYSPITEGLPPPPSRSGSPAREREIEEPQQQRRSRFPFHRRRQRQLEQQQTEMTPIPPEEPLQFGRNLPRPFDDTTANPSDTSIKSTPGNDSAIQSRPPPPPFEDDPPTNEMGQPNTNHQQSNGRDQFQSNTSTHAPFDSRSTTMSQEDSHRQQQ